MIRRGLFQQRLPGTGQLDERIDVNGLSSRFTSITSKIFALPTELAQHRAETENPMKTTE
jgi:hypothetical protein